MRETYGVGMWKGIRKDWELDEGLLFEWAIGEEANFERISGAGVVLFVKGPHVVKG